MSEMIERGARALYGRRGFVGDWDCEHENTRRLWREDARALIEAMREPTGAMKDAGAASYGIGNTYIGGDRVVLDGQPTKAWQAMIDAALSRQES